MITTDERKEINTALAKVIAYQNCGKYYSRDAEDWARKLVQLLQCANILKP
jgi:hypothetical protein